MYLFFLILSKWGAGRGGPCPNFFSPFHKCIFGQYKESNSSKMPINWTLNCFVGCIHIMYTPTKQVFCLYLRRILNNKSFWMSLTLTFLAFKKSCCSFGFCPNEGGGPCPIFFHLFISAFLVNKRSPFPPKCQWFEL